MPAFEPRIAPTTPPITHSTSPVLSPPTSVKSIAGSMTRRKTVAVPAPYARATTTSWGFTCRMPARTASAIGKKPRRKPKAIFEAASRPKKSMSEGYQTTAGAAGGTSSHRSQRLLADLAPELGAQRHHLGRLHRARVLHRQVERRLDPSRPRGHDGHPGRQEERLVQAVRDEDHGLARAPPDVEQPLAHQEARLLVERAERLVHQEDLRVERERAPDRHALLHPARQLARVLLGKAGEAERAQQLGGRLPPALGRHAL